MAAQDLADLLGFTEEDQERLAAAPTPEDAVGPPELREVFLRQLRKRQAEQTALGVEQLLDYWVRLGGHLSFGSAQETGCFLLLRGPEGPRGYNWWPFTMYPAGFCEVVFQHLLRRPPFDDEALREEFRQRCNQAPGIDIPRAKLQLRPSFSLSILAEEAARERVYDALEWFMLAARVSQRSVA
jgi:hypothetical protein